MNTTIIVILSIFFVSIFILIFAALFFIVKRHSQSKDSKFLTNLKVFLGLEKDKDSISQYFDSADNILKYFLKGSVDYKYELPWYISFGASNTGKTSFFSNVNLETPIQLDYNDSSYINHYFFNQGIVLDIKSELIFNSDKHDFCWIRFLETLKKNRLLKPLDGIVYFVSLKDLLSDDPDVLFKLKQTTEALYHKLWQLQDKFEMTVPVYMVFTHLDYVDGFDEFIEKFMKYKDDIFGWSSSFHLNAPFNDEWIESFKSTLNEELKNLLSEVMVNYNAEDSFNMMNFINSFQELYDSIAEYLVSTFKNNKYTKGLYLRGVYFTALDTKSSTHERMIHISNDEVDVDGGQTVSAFQLYFAHDLLVKKVFLEKNIGQELVDKKSVAKELSLLKVGSCVGCLMAGGYSIYLHKNFSFMNEVLYPKVLKLSEVLKEFHDDKNYVNRAHFCEELKIILQYIGDLSDNSLKCRGVPSAWFSSLDTGKTNLILIIVKELVVATLFDQIYSKFKVFSEVKKVSFDQPKQDELFVNPLYSMEFKKLAAFSKQVIDIEEYEQKFNAFKEYNSFSAFSWLLENGLNVKMPKSFEHSVIFSHKLDLSDFDTSKFFEYKKVIKKQFRKLLNKFIVRCFSKTRITQYFERLQNLMHLIDMGDKSFGFDQLKNLHMYIVDLVDTFNSSSFEWLKSVTFGSSNLANLLKEIEGSVLLGGKDTVNEIINRTTISFYDFKKTLGGYQLPLLGAPFYIKNDVICLANDIIDFQGRLNSVFSESFMEKLPKCKISKINSSQCITWNAAEIKHILNVISEYQKFKDLQSKTKLEVMFKQVARKNICNLIQHQMIHSHQIIALDINHVNLASICSNVKNTVEDLYKIFEFLYKANIKSFNLLTKLQYESLFNILTYIDKAMEFENLYDIREDKFLLNSKTRRLKFSFNMTDYLNAQKKQLEFFVVNLVQHVCIGLEHLYLLNDMMPEDLFVKWKGIKKDIDDYKNNPANSKLYMFEELASKIQVAPLNELFSGDLKKLEYSLNKELFFDSKVLILHQRLNVVLSSAISRLLLEQYDLSMLFYNRYSASFPFNPNGAMIGLAGFTKMQELIKEQQEVISLVQLIRPNYDSSIFKFIKNLVRLSNFMNFLMSMEESLSIEFKNYRPVGDLYESNLALIVSCEAKVNGQKSLNLYKQGVLKVFDLVCFEITLSNRTNKRIVKKNISGVSINKNVIRYNLDKQGLVKFLMSNVIEINGESFLRFTIDIEDDKGMKDQVVIMVPIDISLGGVRIKVPEKSFFTIAVDEEKNNEKN